LKKLIDDVRFTLYPDANHNSWDKTYANDSLYTWFLRHKRKLPVEVPVPKAQLKKYEGNYVGQGGDTLHIKLTENGLLMPLYGDEQHLVSLGRDEFFLKEMDQVQLTFEKNNMGIWSFIMFGDKKTTYTTVRKKK
jgi:hypothetical protein